MFLGVACCCSGFFFPGSCLLASVCKVLNSSQPKDPPIFENKSLLLLVTRNSTQEFQDNFISIKKNVFSLPAND